MCIAPMTIISPDGPTPVGCRECWQCREQTINDWVGRNIAESKTAKATHSITLTYGRDEEGNEDHLRARLLTPSDPQGYFKRLRANGYPCRYFLVGEYGSQRGRAHWHIIVYWLDRVPPHTLDKRFHEKHWPHGLSHWEKPSFHAIRYVCKYIQKGRKRHGSEGYLSMSRFPPLGDAYFKRLAENYVNNRFAPQDLFYTFEGVTRSNKRKNSEKIRFMMRGKTADNFLAHYVQKWREKWPNKHIPNSELVEEYLDKMEPDNGSGFEPDPDYLKPPRPVPMNLARWMLWEYVSYDEATKHWCYREPNGLVLYYTKTIGGAPAWRNDPGEVLTDAYKMPGERAHLPRCNVCKLPYPEQGCALNFPTCERSLSQNTQSNN